MKGDRLASAIALAIFSIAALQTPVEAAVYDVHGTLTGFQYINPPNAANPVTIDTIYTPTPTANGLWNIDLLTASMQGSLDIESFNAHAIVRLTGGVIGTQDYFYPHFQNTLGAVAGSFDSNSHTLSLISIPVSDDGAWATCLPTSSIPCPTPGPLSDLGTVSMAMTLVFDETFHSFSGTGTYTLIHTTQDRDINSWTFSGTEVPVPAAAWLFGSGLIALGGIGRRRV